MKKLFTMALLALSTVSVQSQAGQVHGYVRHDGTYVAPHYRSDPDGNPYNNNGCLYNGNC